MESTRGDLAWVAKRDKRLAESGMAAAALALAARIDDAGTHPTAVANCARELRDTMAAIRVLLPPEKVRDGVDDLQRRRSSRRKRAS